MINITAGHNQTVLKLYPTTRNSRVLESFVDYCIAHPELRFYQALLNWSGVPFILVSSSPVHEIGPDTVFTDPYNWEHKDG